jgi:hypothetical protein
VRSRARPYSCFNRPNSRSTAARLLLVRILPGAMGSALVRWAATLLLVFAVGLLVYLIAWA